jgi:PIN domain nuclease of toxin-antitoxin system
VRILLDTQCWLWMAAFPERLSARTRELVASRDHQLYLSAASAWEIAIKHSRGKLQLPETPEHYVMSRCDRLHTEPLPIDHSHALRVATLPSHHRDPFDRVLVAQAQIEGLPLLTSDPIFRLYDVDLMSV